MIKKNYRDIGFLFKLETKDFKGDWKTFMAQVKKIGAVYQPAEFDNAENFWYLPNKMLTVFEALQKKYIDSILRDQESYERIGYKPIPRQWRKYR